MTQAHWRAMNGGKRAEIRAWIYRRDDGQCWRCGTFTSLGDGDVDHLDGQAGDHDGRHTTDTLRMAWACIRCNRGRGNVRKRPRPVIRYWGQ